MKGIEKKETVLAVGAHPDDVEFMCGGTLALMSSKGFNIHISSICTGNMGSSKLRKAEISRKRFREATQAAKILNAKYSSLGESDLYITFNNSIKAKTVELIRRVNPKVVITHSPEDYMKDHEVVSEIVWDSCFIASVPNYDTNQINPAKPTKGIPYLFYSDAIDGIDRFGRRVTADFYVDITKSIKIKESMLAKHQSQRSWLKKQHGIDQYLLMMRNWSAERGLEVNVEFAEAFRQHRGHSFPTRNILENFVPVLRQKK